MLSASIAALPRDEELDSKATGQYEFQAISPSGKVLHGILPLRVNGGQMAASIAFFAPALFIGGFREAYALYPFDPDAGVVRFKLNESESWRTYVPVLAESERARNAFAAQPLANSSK